MAGLVKVWSCLPTLSTIAPSFVGGPGIDAEDQGCPLHPIHRLERSLHHHLCLQMDRLRQVQVGGWLLLSIFEAAVQKHVLGAQPKLHYCVIEHILSFHNHGMFSEPLMTG